MILFYQCYRDKKHADIVCNALNYDMAEALGIPGRAKVVRSKNGKYLILFLEESK